MDMSQIPDADLEHIANGNMDQVSTATLERLAGGTSPPEQPDNGRIDGVPKWGRDNPNIYAGVMTGLDLAPTLANFAKSSVVGLPVAGVINAGSKYLQRQISGDDTDAGKVLSDFAKGATVEGVGRAGAGIIKGITDIPAIQSGLQNMGRKLYKSAMKFSNSPNVLTPAERNAITETGLKNGFLPNDESYLRLKGQVDTNTAAVDDIIERGSAAGDIIPANDVLAKGDIAGLMQYGQRVRGAYQGHHGASFNDEVAGVVDNLRKGESVAPYTPSDINASKRQLYKTLESAYGDNTLHTPTVQAQKQLAKGMKEALESLYPEVKNLNANSAELLALSGHLARSMGRIGNRDVIGLGDKIVMDMVTGKAANPATAAAGLLTLIDQPQIKARVAQVLYKANTGKNLPLSQWKKGLQYIGQVAAPAARTAFEGAMYTTGGNNDPLGIRR